jgi:hypothetical protein
MSFSQDLHGRLKPAFGIRLQGRHYSFVKNAINAGASAAALTLCVCPGMV